MTIWVKQGREYIGVFEALVERSQELYHTLMNPSGDEDAVISVKEIAQRIEHHDLSVDIVQEFCEAVQAIEGNVTRNEHQGGESNES